jgi:hypothetical protein
MLNLVNFLAVILLFVVLYYLDGAATRLQRIAETLSRIEVRLTNIQGDSELI